MTAYIVLGVNGSGKTTYYKDILKDNLKDLNVAFINADEIKIGLVNQGVNNEVAKVKSGQIAISEIGKCISKKQAFSLETTFTDDGAMGSIAIIKELKKAGFKVVGYNVYTDDVDLNVERVRVRHLKGIGHFVPENIIRYRHEKYSNNVMEHHNLFDTLHYINNTTFDFSLKNHADFIATRTSKEDINYQIIEEIMNINPNYKVLTKEEFQNNLFDKSIKEEMLKEKYLDFLKMEYKATLTEKGKSLCCDTSTEVDLTQARSI